MTDEWQTRRATPILGKGDSLFGCMIHYDVLNKVFSTKEEMEAPNPFGWGFVYF
jgi:hypothetical protein